MLPALAVQAAKSSAPVTGIPLDDLVRAWESPFATCPPAPAPQQPPSPSAAAVRATPVERAALCPSLANEPGKKRCGK